MKKFNLFIDGASRGNPGVSGIGYVLYDGKNEIKRGLEFVGKKTNNEAEYLALIKGLEESIPEKVDSLSVFSDSQLLIKQLNGEYKIKSEPLRVYFEKVQTLIKDLAISFIWIPRSDNQVADSLANKAIDSNKSSSFLTEKSFFGKTTCFKLQISNEFEIYFHAGVISQNKKSWDWVKAKMSETEIGDVVHLLESEEGSVSFYHKFKDKKTQIWCKKSKDSFSIKIDTISKNLSIGEFVVLREFLKESLRKKFFFTA